MPSFSDIFTPNPLRVTANEVFLQFTKSPIDFIKAPKQKEAFVLEGAEEVVVEEEEEQQQETQEEGAPPSDDGTQPDTPDGNGVRKSFRHPKDEEEEEDNANNSNDNASDSAIAASFDAFLQLVAQHPAVSNLILASQHQAKTQVTIKRDEIRYAVEPLAPSATSGFSNRFDQKLYDNFIALIKAREDAEKSRKEHDKIMATRPPPTPPPEEEHNDDDDNNNNGGGYGGREVQYDEDGNEIEVDDEEENQNNHHNNSSGAVAAVAARPRKTRAQRREEEKQRKEDKKREFEVEQKEHLVACMEQKLANALCAAAIRVVIAP